MRARRSRVRFAAIVGAAAFLVAGSLVGSNAPPANATTYPTWADVVAARNNASKTRAEVNKIKGLLASLKSQLATANTNAVTTGAAAVVAEQSYTLAEDKDQTLHSQEETAAAKADKSKRELGAYASELARGPGGGGGWSTLSLLLNGKSEGQLLNTLGAALQVSQADDEILQRALADQNSVKQLRSLATAQAHILAVRKQAADAAKAAAAAAAAKLQAAVTAEAEHQQVLTVLLTALTSKYSMTFKQYEAGVIAAGGAGIAGVVDAQGWALPTAGVISSPWGYRFDPAQGYRWAMHYGDDIADGCLRPIYAAYSGTVAYAAVYGDIGNQIVINNGGGVSTAYGHIANGETFVHVGQYVLAGQNIARTGSTGFSTGCHLYFQVSVGGGWVNPAPFMSQRGIVLG
jgi:murein DD-endopeptidase MepM/ murein hydrolase activator NlpD